MVSPQPYIRGVTIFEPKQNTHSFTHSNPSDVYDFPQDCPLEEPDFRISQCAKFNGKWYNINGLDKSVRWLPKYTGGM